MFSKVLINTKCECTIQLDGVYLDDNRSSTTSSATLSKEKRKEKFDTWHMTPDTWHPAFDTRHVKHGGRWTFSQTFSFLALTVCDLWCCEDWEEKDDWIK